MNLKKIFSAIIGTLGVALSFQSTTALSSVSEVKEAELSKIELTTVLPLTDDSKDKDIKTITPVVKYKVLDGVKENTIPQEILQDPKNKLVIVSDEFFDENGKRDVRLHGDKVTNVAMSEMRRLNLRNPGKLPENLYVIGIGYDGGEFLKQLQAEKNINAEVYVNISWDGDNETTNTNLH